MSWESIVVPWLKDRFLEDHVVSWCISRKRQWWNSAIVQGSCALGFCLIRWVVRSFSCIKVLWLSWKVRTVTRKWPFQMACFGKYKLKILEYFFSLRMRERFSWLQSRCLIKHMVRLKRHFPLGDVDGLGLWCVLGLDHSFSLVLGLSFILSLIFSFLLLSFPISLFVFLTWMETIVLSLCVKSRLKLERELKCV